jgi:hypothetical protein
LLNPVSDNISQASGLLSYITFYEIII